ncbi:hypothetical protein MKW94_005721 [Papaver nudicaule]|uniref:DUF7903 domain-containing protein n=1 Tax=Papaver nudicaule TaxID=74823 RepID=A0AA41V933_PAPNU|nr:hypothetical protein [Papaver nudicaule]
MANYIPPHKRQLKDGAKALAGSSLNSRSLAHTFQQQLNLSGSFNSESCSSESVRRRMYLHPKSCVSRFFIVDSTKEEEHQNPGSVRLNRISSDSILYDKVGSSPYILVSSCKKTGTDKLKRNSSIENPLISVAEQILPNLLAFRRMRVEASGYKEFKEGEIRLVARFGQILFHGTPSLNIDTLRDRSELEASLSGIRRSFDTHIPKSFPESVLNVVVPEIGVELEEEKEYYYVRVIDKSCLDVSFTCKCTTTGVGGLELRKIEANHVRHMIVDIACVEKDLDLRFMLSTRNFVPEASDEEKHGLEKLIKSAVVDGNEKGGLRFPLGYESLEGRYRVVGIGHTTMRAFKNSSIKIKFTESDRYEFNTSTAEVTNHVVLIMNGITEILKENNLETDQLARMLEDTMKLLWDYFLRLECCFS